MNIKNYLKTYLLFIIILITYLLVFSLLYYLELFNYKTLNIINYINMIIIFFINGIKISHLECKKGYLNGFIISVVLIIIFSLISLIISKLTFSSLVYYLTLILSSITGGIIGVQNKTVNKDSYTK